MKHGELDAPVVQRIASAAEKPRKLYARIERHLLDGSRFVRSWDYHSSDGAYLYTVARYDSPTLDGRKTFLPWQPVGKQWAMDERELTRVLYRLPQLRAAALDMPIFAPEGEKCCEALRERGLVATCSAGGAGNWHRIPGARDELNGRHVVILPDNDEPGRRHAEQIAADLAGVAASVKIVALPGLAEHGDVCDWLAAGGDALHLALRALATQPYSAAPMAEASKTAGARDDDETAARQQHEQAALRAANVELNRRLSWTERVVAVPKERLSPGAAQTAIFMQRELPKHQHQLDPAGFWMPYMPAVAKARGVSATTLGQHLIELADVGALRRRELYQMKVNGQRVMRVQIAPGLLLDSPEDWIPAKGARKQHGGARANAGRPRKCASCQSSNVQIVERTVRVMTCRDCGAVESEQIGADRPVLNTPEGPATPDVDRAEGRTGFQDEKRYDAFSRGESKESVSDDVCVRCGGELDCYDAGGRPFCEVHTPQREAG